MAEGRVPFSKLLAGYGTTTIGEGMHVTSVFALLKVRAENGSAAWMVRSGGSSLPPEELLGVLDGLTTSMRLKLTRAWKGQAPAPRTGKPPVPVAFSELLAGLETVGRRRRVRHRVGVRSGQGPARRWGPVWLVRSSEMQLSSEERLGALEGYSATVRQDLADKWKW